MQFEWELFGDFPLTKGLITLKMGCDVQYEWPAYFLSTDVKSKNQKINYR